LAMAETAGKADRSQLTFPPISNHMQSTANKRQSGVTDSWTYLDPRAVSADAFGLKEVHAVKVKRFREQMDVRNYDLAGWQTCAELTDYDPDSGEPLEAAEWFVFAAQGKIKEVAAL